MVSKKKVKKKMQSFQDTILNLQKFWSKKGCLILHPYDIEVGAGTFHPATTLFFGEISDKIIKFESGFWKKDN